MNTVIQTDEALFNLLLNTDYFDLLELCSADTRINAMCNNKMLWIQKAKRDFGVDITGVTSTDVKNEYFKLYDYLPFDTDNVDNTNFRNVIILIFERCKAIEFKSKNKARIYFAGFTIEEPPGTKFEESSLDLRIGFIAKSKTVANVLLSLVQIIVDNSIESLKVDSEVFIDNFEETAEVHSVAEFVEDLAKQKGFQGVNFDLDRTFRRKLTNYNHNTEQWEEQFVTNTIGYVDVWTIERLEQELPKFLNSLP